VTPPPGEPSIRPEFAEDVPGIRTVHRAAFPTDAEAVLVDRLRADGDLALSLVARLESDVVGHIAFSPMKAPIRALALAPLAVAERVRGQGIGAMLIRTGLQYAAEAGWQCVFVLGDPAYYASFGFSVEAAASFDCVYAGPHLMMCILGENRMPSGGILTYAPAFSAL
jgi:putative acetyltransferase